MSSQVNRSTCQRFKIKSSAGADPSGTSPGSLWKAQPSISMATPWSGNAMSIRYGPAG
jgi:hypothetical protein